MAKKIGFWVSLFFVFLALISTGIYVKEKLTKKIPEEQIIHSSDTFKPKLKSFLDIVDGTVDQIRQKAASIDVDVLSKEKLNAYFSVLIEQNEYLQGIVILGSETDYALVKDKKTWLMTHTVKHKFVDWYRLNNKLQVITEWTNANNALMDTSNLSSIKASAMSQPGRIWLTTESEIPEKRDIIFSIFKLERSDNTDVVALIYRTSQLGQRFSQSLHFENPLVTLVTANRLVTPMQTSNDEDFVKLRNLSKKVNVFIQDWQRSNDPSSKLFSFEDQTLNYWLRIDTITPRSGISAFAIAVSQPDLLKSNEKYEQIFIYAAIMFLLFALFAYLTTNRNNLKNEDAGTALKELSIDEIIDLIERGESENVEFKSSLRWDYNLQKMNHFLEIVILKTITAFTNASGGVLFIGVDDDFKILGLEPDLNTFAKKNVDYFELHLRKLINTQFGVRFSNKYTLIRFPVIHGRTICVVQVAKADKPQFLKLKNKHGVIEEKFYVRTGNASQQISSLTEINQYIQGHFSEDGRN